MALLSANCLEMFKNTHENLYVRIHFRLYFLVSKIVRGVGALAPQEKTADVYQRSPIYVVARFVNAAKTGSGISNFGAPWNLTLKPL